jgi:hypothetical protein
MSIEDAHRRLRDLIGDDIEPLASALEVERLRQAWRPEPVRVALLAESHVWTSAEEASLRVGGEGCAESGFARFVYCLGYGEPSLVTIAGNRGTPQYWRLFHDCLDGPDVAFEHLTRKQRDDRLRIQAKQNLLRRMRDAGLWLIDASVTALYRSGGRRVSGGVYRRVLQTSWDSHVGQVVGDSRPDALVVIGRNVWNALSDRLTAVLPAERIEVICQPQARLSAAERAEERRRCHAFCSRYLHRPVSVLGEAIAGGQPRLVSA